MTFTASQGRVFFENREVLQIHRARIKSALKAMGDNTRNVETLNRLDSVFMALIRAGIEANNQARKAA